MTAAEGAYVASECVELDGCCQTHSPCFLPENDDVDDGSTCTRWPCPADQRAD